MELDNLRRRASFKYGDRNIPTPGKLCLFKLSAEYIARENCPYWGFYLIGSVREYHGKLQLIVENPALDGWRHQMPKKISTYNERFIDYWIYIEDIEKFKLLKK